MDKEYQALLDEIIDGPMVGRWSAEAEEKTLVDSGIIERFMDVMGPFIVPIVWWACHIACIKSEKYFFHC